MKKNMDIRGKAKKYGVYLWEIAEELGIAEATFTRKMRKELSETEKIMIFSVIEIIAKRKTKLM